MGALRGKRAGNMAYVTSVTTGKNVSGDPGKTLENLMDVLKPGTNSVTRTMEVIGLVLTSGSMPPDPGRSIDPMARIWRASFPDSFFVFVDTERMASAHNIGEFIRIYSMVDHPGHDTTTYHPVPSIDVDLGIGELLRSMRIHLVRDRDGGGRDEGDRDGEGWDKGDRHGDRRDKGDRHGEGWDKGGRDDEPFEDRDGPDTPMTRGHPVRPSRERRQTGKNRRTDRKGLAVTGGSDDHAARSQGAGGPGGLRKSAIKVRHGTPAKGTTSPIRTMEELTDDVLQLKGRVVGLKRELDSGTHHGVAWFTQSVKSIKLDQVSLMDRINEVIGTTRDITVKIALYKVRDSLSGDMRLVDELINEQYMRTLSELMGMDSTSSNRGPD